MPEIADLLAQALAKLQTANRIDGGASGNLASYRKDNRTEYLKVVGYLQGGLRPTGVTSDMGVGLMGVEDARRQAAGSDPDPDPGPLPPGAKVIDGPEDLHAVINPSWVEPAVYGGANGGGMYEIQTPKGRGMKFVCPPFAAPWDNEVKIAFAAGDSEAVPSKSRWEFDVYIPQQPIVTSQRDFAGVLFEIGHTDSSSGHNLCIHNYTEPRLVFGRNSALGMNYTHTDLGPLVFDQWIPIVIEVGFSYGSDGFLRVKRDGVQKVNFTGKTAWEGDGNPYLQLGMYTNFVPEENFTSESRFSPIVRTPL